MCHCDEPPHSCKSFAKGRFQLFLILVGFGNDVKVALEITPSPFS